MPFVLPIGIVVAIAVLLYAFLLFDRVVRAEYENAREAWEVDGRPRGFFWKAPECTVYRSTWALNHVSFAWLFATPAWASHSPAFRNSLRRWRISVLTWNVLVVAALVLAAWFL